jgi:hypothetical protein
MATKLIVGLGLPARGDHWGDRRVASVRGEHVVRRDPRAAGRAPDRGGGRMGLTRSQGGIPQPSRRAGQRTKREQAGQLARPPRVAGPRQIPVTRCAMRSWKRRSRRAEDHRRRDRRPCSATVFADASSGRSYRVSRPGSNVGATRMAGRSAATTDDPDAGRERTTMGCSRLFQRSCEATSRRAPPGEMPNGDLHGQFRPQRRKSRPPQEQPDAASGVRCSGRSSTCSPHPPARRAGVTRRAAC